MDISRLPATSIGRTANPGKSIQPVVSSDVEAIASVRPVSSSPRRAAGVQEHIVQGELLLRERGNYQSTRSFINDRSADLAQPSDRQTASGYQSRSAVSLYLNNTRPEAITDITQGQSVNLFV